MEVIKAPDPRLRIKTAPVKKVTPEHQQIIREMIEVTKSFVDPEGVGLASTQVGKGEQYFVLKKTDGTFKAIFNPKIISYGKKSKVFFEGCLSIPNYYGEITRPTSVTVSYMGQDGKTVQERLTGMDAWIFQHEYDHLQGRLFVDICLEQKSRLFKVVGKDRAGAEVFEEVRL
jgi:peptide deformylase